MKKLLKNIVYILFLIITHPFVIIYSTIRVISNLLETIYNILCDLEEEISSIKTK